MSVQAMSCLNLILSFEYEVAKKKTKKNFFFPLVQIGKNVFNFYLKGILFLSVFGLLSVQIVDSFMGIMGVC